MTKGILQKKESIWAQGSRGSESTIVGEAWHQEQGAEGSHLNYIQEAERENRKQSGTHFLQQYCLSQSFYSLPKQRHLLGPGVQVHEPMETFLIQAATVTLQR